jgi:hypothetical protein
LGLCYLVFLLPHIENIIFLHEEIRHFVSVCWVCVTLFFYSLILRKLYFYIKKSDILFLFVGSVLPRFFCSLILRILYFYIKKSDILFLLGLCYLVFLLSHIENIIFLHEEIRHFVSVCWVCVTLFFYSLILRILYFYMKKSDILFLFVGSVLPRFFTPSYWENYIFTWRNQTFCFCLLGLCYLVFLLSHIENIIFLHEEIRHFVSVCWVCVTSFFYSLILRILYFYMKYNY